MWSYIFVVRLDYKLLGVGIANTMTELIDLVVIYIYVTYYLPELKEAWSFPNKECFRHLGEYMKIAMPSMLLICLEWWSFEVLTIISSLISVNATAA